MPFVFEASSIKRAFVCYFFFLNIVFRFEASDIKSTLVELTGSKSLFSVKSQASTLDHSHHLLVKCSCKTACKNRDAISARFAVCFLQPTIGVEEAVIVAAIMIALFIFTIFWCTLTHV